MENKNKNYNLNLDSLTLFFLVDKEKIRKRIWFEKDSEKKYEKLAQRCYENLFTENEILRWEDENWTCDLFDKEISFILERKANEEWREVKFIEKIFFSNWNTDRDSFENQIKKLINIFFKEKILSLSEHKIKFKIRFYGKNEEKRPDISISLIVNNENEIKKEHSIALEITECDTSPRLINGASLHKMLDDKIEKRDLIEARKLKNILEDVDIKLYFPNLFRNMKDALLKKNRKDYGCEKTIIWIIASVYCHVEVENLKSGETSCFAIKSGEVEDVFLSRFLLEEIKKMSKELQENEKKIYCDYLMIKYLQTIQTMESRDDGKFYKLASFAKGTLYIPVILGEIKVEKELEEIQKKYKEEMENLRMILYQNAISLRDEQDSEDEEW